METRPESQIRRLPSLRPIVFVLVAGLLTGLGIAAPLGWNLVLLLLGATLIVGWSVTLLVGFAFLLASLHAVERRGSIGPWLCRTALLLGILFAAQCIGLFTGVAIRESQVAAAIRWCDGLAPSLEAWRERTGQYPNSLADLAIELNPPAMCREHLLYRSGPTGYWLDFSDGGLFSGYAFSSERGSWSRYD